MSKPDPVDEHDYKMASFQGSIKLPSKLDLRNGLGDVLDQGKRGTCAAHTAAVMKQWEEYRDTGHITEWSPEFVYFHRVNKPDAGMYARDVMKILKNKGICSERTLPYKTESVTTLPLDANVEALGYAIKTYARIETIHSLKQALYEEGPCYISFPTYTNRPEFWRAKPSEKYNGGHAVAVIGYNKKGFILRNSWGKYWNGDGHVIYPYSDWGMHWDCWSTVDKTGSKPRPESKSIFKFFTCW